MRPLHDTVLATQFLERRGAHACVSSSPLPLSHMSAATGFGCARMATCHG